MACIADCVAGVYIGCSDRDRRGSCGGAEARLLAFDNTRVRGLLDCWIAGKDGGSCDETED